MPSRVERVGMLAGELTRFSFYYSQNIRFAALFASYPVPRGSKLTIDLLMERHWFSVPEIQVARYPRLHQPLQRRPPVELAIILICGESYPEAEKSCKTIRAIPFLLC